MLNAEVVVRVGVISIANVRICKVSHGAVWIRIGKIFPTGYPSLKKIIRVEIYVTSDILRSDRKGRMSLQPPLNDTLVFTFLCCRSVH